MKDILKGAIIVILISCFSIFIPFALLNKVEQCNYDNVNVTELDLSDNKTYFEKYSDIINNNLDNQDLRTTVVEMNLIAGKYYDIATNNARLILLYFEIIIIISLIIIGLCNLKNQNKKYVSYALIVSGIITLLGVIIEVINFCITHS